MAIEPLGSVEGSAAYSPMTLVMRYLNSVNQEPNADNIRRAIEANARNPGLIEGLRNMMPEDSSPAQPSTRVAAKSTADRNATGGEFDVGQGSGTPTTSAAPPAAAAGPGTPVGASASDIAAATLGLLLPSSAAYLATRNKPQVGASVPPVSEVAPDVVPPTAAPEPTPMEAALNKATAERYGPPEPSYTGDMPPVNQDLVGTRRPGPSTSVEMRPLPFTSQSPRVAPTAEQQAQMDRLRELNIPKITGSTKARPRVRVP